MFLECSFWASSVSGQAMFAPCVWTVADTTLGLSGTHATVLGSLIIVCGEHLPVHSATVLGLRGSLLLAGNSVQSPRPHTVVMVQSNIDVLSWTFLHDC